MPRPSLRALLALSFVLLLPACAVEQVAKGSSDLAPVNARSTQAAGDAWRSVDAAMELRTLRLEAGEVSGEATAVRFDPKAYSVSVKHDITNAGSIREWFRALKPLAVINGGYFDEAGRPTALVIFDGITRGESYQGFGGMVAINAEGQFELRSLRQQPYDPSESLQQAMQSAPMLIQPGGTISDFEADDERSRRSVIARDSQGRILLLAVNMPTFSLAELARALHDSDLDLDVALNLDGGRSTGLFVNAGDGEATIDSMERVPLVLVVERLGER
jgi:uncharacterized protein YigE (DUF2233 family)